MKFTLIIVLFLFIKPAISQKNMKFTNFHQVNSYLPISIDVINSNIYKVELIGVQALTKNIDFKVFDKTLIIDSKSNLDKINLDSVSIKIYTPKLNSFSVLNGGYIKMEGFSKMNSLVITTSENSIIDLRNIDFNTLIVNSEKNSRVIYKSVNTLIFSNKREGVVERFKK